MQIGFVDSEDKPKTGRPVIFTPERIEQIRNLVERGMSTEDIAGIIGCTPGTLKVRCSQLGVSLRRIRFSANGGNSPKIVPIKPVEEPPAKQEPRVSVVLRMEYRGLVRDTPISLTDQQLVELALEAEIRNVKLGELIVKLIMEMVGKL